MPYLYCCGLTNEQSKKGPENITFSVEIVTSQLAIIHVMELIIYNINVLWKVPCLPLDSYKL